MGDAALKLNPQAQAVLTQEVSGLVNKITGIQLGEKQAPMVQNRIKKRIHQLGLPDEQAYLEYLRENKHTEITALVSLLTTHHTYFFRESAHFDYIEKTALPALIEAKRKTGDRKIRVWSAACSRGQEVYSLAMLISHVLGRLAPDFTFEILGTDVDPESVKIAKNGVYLRKEIEQVPLTLLGQHWARGTGDIKDFVRAKDSLKKRCRFSVMNLLEVPILAEADKYDLILCRNVFIYFTVEQIKAISTRLLATLSKDGFFFIGISETLNGQQLPVSVVGASIYRHPAMVMAAAPAPKSTAAPAARPTPVPAPAAATPPMRVLCVDDSPVILNLLKKILVRDSGFEVVATAANGFEAAKKMQEQKFDVVTLDIHMPEQGGLELLESLNGKPHPPIVMVSSVARDAAELAFRCLEAGAVDYVEKPALADLMDRAEEIRSKLRYAAESILDRGALKLEKSFAKESAAIPDPDQKLRVVLATLADRQRVVKFLQGLKGPSQPPVLILIEGAGAGLVGLQGSLAKQLPSFRVSVPENWGGQAPGTNEIWLMEPRTLLAAGRQPSPTISVVAFGPVTSKVAQALRAWSNTHILLDENVAATSPLRPYASDVGPATSFPYQSHEFLCRGRK